MSYIPEPSPETHKKSQLIELGLSESLNFELNDGITVAAPAISDETTSKLTIKLNY